MMSRSDVAEHWRKMAAEGGRIALEREQRLRDRHEETDADREREAAERARYERGE